jgi:hypothetical protein
MTTYGHSYISNGFPFGDRGAPLTLTVTHLLAVEAAAGTVVEVAAVAYTAVVVACTAVAA